MGAIAVCHCCEAFTQDTLLTTLCVIEGANSPSSPASLRLLVEASSSEIGVDASISIRIPYWTVNPAARLQGELVASTHVQVCGSLAESFQNHHLACFVVDSIETTDDHFYS